MKYQLVRTAMVVVLSVLPFSVNAGAWCPSDQITRILLNSNDILFYTDKSCPSATVNCKINPSWSADQINKAYAMLLAAKTQGKAVYLYFNEVSSSCASVPDGSSPALIMLEQ